MEILKVIIISIIQGISEFIPVSSSGHILLFKKIFGLNYDMSFDIVIHAGTLLSVFVIYFKDIKDLILGVFYSDYKSPLFNGIERRKDYLHIYSLFIISTLPAVAAGLFLKDFIYSFFVIENNSVFLFLAVTFTYTLVLLVLSGLYKNKKNFDLKTISFKIALLIGCFQALALFPGISRSGSTITGALILGVDKKEAGRYSFLLSIPLILAAFLLDIIDLVKGNLTMSPDMLLNYAAGFFVSFLVGVAALKLLLSLIQKGKIWYFAVYLILPIITSIFIGAF